METNWALIIISGSLSFWKFRLIMWADLENGSYYHQYFISQNSYSLIGEYSFSQKVKFIYSISPFIIARVSNVKTFFFSVYCSITLNNLFTPKKKTSYNLINLNFKFRKITIRFSMDYKLKMGYNHLNLFRESPMRWITLFFSLFLIIW